MKSIYDGVGDCVVFGSLGGYVCDCGTLCVCCLHDCEVKVPLRKGVSDSVSP